MLKRNLIANYLGQGWRALMSLAFVPLYIKFLGIEAWGVIGFFAILQAWLSLLDMGMRPTLNREMARFSAGAYSSHSIRDLLRSFEIITLALALIIAVVIWQASDWLASDWFKAETISANSISRAFVVMGFVASLGFIESIYSSSISGLQHQVQQNIITSTMATIRGGGAVAVMAYVSPTLEAFFIWQAIISLATLLLLGGSVYQLLPKKERQARFSTTELKKVWRFASGMLGITILGLLLSQLDKILLSRLLSLEAFGYYILAANIAQLLNLFTAPIVTAFFPRLTQLVADNNIPVLAQTYHLSAQLLSVLVGSLAAMLIIFSKPLIMVWTGDATLTAKTASLLSIISMGTLFNRLVSGPYRLQLAYGWTSLAIRVNIIAVVLIVPALLLITPKYGALGAAYVWCGLNLGNFFIVASLTHRRLLPGEKSNWYLKDILVPLGLTFSAALLLYAAMPENLDRIEGAAYLTLSSICVLCISTISAKLVRQPALSLCHTAIAVLTNKIQARRSSP